MNALYTQLRTRGLTAERAYLGAKLASRCAIVNAALLDFLAFALRGWSAHQVRTFFVSNE
jgi:hypothetical protein